MQIQGFVSGVRRLGLGLFLIAVSVAGAQATGVQSAERFVIRYHAGTFELVTRMTIQKVLPPTLPLADPSGKISGAWFELQSSTGRVLYRRPFALPQIAYVETPNDSIPGQLQREETTVTERTFVITVPQRGDAQEVVFYGQPAGAQSKSAASQVMGRIRLR